MRQYIKGTIILILLISLPIISVILISIKRIDYEEQCYNSIQSCEPIQEINKKCKRIFDSEDIYFQIKLTDCKKETK